MKNLAAVFCNICPPPLGLTLRRPPTCFTPAKHFASNANVSPFKYFGFGPSSTIHYCCPESSSQQPTLYDPTHQRPPTVVHAVTWTFRDSSSATVAIIQLGNTVVDACSRALQSTLSCCIGRVLIWFKHQVYSGQSPDLLLHLQWITLTNRIPRQIPVSRFKTSPGYTYRFPCTALRYHSYWAASWLSLV